MPLDASLIAVVHVLAFQPFNLSTRFHSSAAGLGSPEVQGPPGATGEVAFVQQLKVAVVETPGQLLIAVKSPPAVARGARGTVARVGVPVDEGVSAFAGQLRT